jgi:RTX calcium-binding nonapeptide repeat (4 copies)
VRGAHRLRAALLAGLLCLVVAAPARGEWRPVAVPGGHVQHVAVADADTWLLQAAPGEPRFEVTDDAGASWAPLQIAGYPTAFVAGAAADDTFRALAWREGAPSGFEAQVFRVGPDGSVAPLGAALTGIGVSIFSTGAAVAEDGTTWVPFEEEASGDFKLRVVGGDGGTTTTTLPEVGATAAWGVERTALGLRLLRYEQEGFSVAFAGTYRLDGAGQVVPAEPHPVSLVDGELWLASTGRASWDGGVHWSETALPPTVPRAPSPGGMPRLLGTAGRLVERHSPFLFRGTGLQRPGVVQPGLVDAGSALVTWSEDAIYVHSGALPPPPAAIGSLEADTQQMLDRANLFRADAGLPPLIGDALVSQAARNHSNYLALNPSSLQAGSFHHETPGTPGYTGEGPSQRCEAVGTTCSGEVGFSPGAVDPVGGWLATPFHRPLLGSPQAGVVGAAQPDGGAAVMNSQYPLPNELVRPFGYPNGLWRGDSGFFGEIPDPVAICNEDGQAISEPVGIAVTLYLPTQEGTVTSIAVRRGGGSPLPGCLLRGSDPDGDATGMFVLDDPLEPGQDYLVSALWNPGPEFRPGGVAVPAATLAHEWSFAYRPEAGGEEVLALGGARRRCFGRRVTLAGTGRRDVLRGSKRPDVIAGLGGNDVIRGLGRRDLVCGGPGHDRIFGGKGGDRLAGEGGRDRLYGGAGRDRLAGGPARDRLYGGPGVDRLLGGRARDLLRGGGPKNRLRQ